MHMSRMHMRYIVYMYFQVCRPLTNHSPVVSESLSSYPYPAVVNRQPATAEGENETTARSIPIPGSAMWPSIGITMQYVFTCTIFCTMTIVVFKVAH